MNNQVDLNKQAQAQIPQIQAAAAFVNGKTDVDFHWWGATVYLSRNTLIGIGGGIAIAGLWIPELVVSKAAKSGQQSHQFHEERKLALHNLCRS
ncbi:hypothetical protein ACOMCU_27005 [Lysinibacillus sp. UGB7]|uniref:hypothetical protein n=1 Tax=Lysinibacillus sp. UGB7 TaxID=3411039 RepID=UPI003B78F637